MPFGDDEAAHERWKNYYNHHLHKYDGERLPRSSIVYAYLALGKVDKALEEAKKILPSDARTCSLYRSNALVRCAAKLIESGEIARARETLLLAEEDIAGSHSNYNVVYCHIDLSHVYLDMIRSETNRERALALSRSTIERAWATWFPDGVRFGFRVFKEGNGLELLLRQQAAMGVSEGLIAQPVADWTTFATFADRFMNLQENLEHARNPRENASPSEISSELANVAKRMYCVYLTIERMEGGQVDTPAAGLFASDLFSD